MEIQDNDDIIMIVLSPSEDLVKLEFIPTMDDYSNADAYDPEVKKLRYRNDMDELSSIVTQCAHNSISLYEAYKKYTELRSGWDYTEEIDPPRFCVIVGDIVDRVYRLEDMAELAKPYCLRDADFVTGKIEDSDIDGADEDYINDIKGANVYSPLLENQTTLIDIDEVISEDDPEYNDVK